MPKWLSHFLDSKDLGAHLRLALAFGFLTRACSAWFVYGPQALDDYKHGVWPAYQFFAGQTMDLPEYRSHLLVWLLAAFVKLASFVNATSALAQVRAMYFGLALLSLSAIYGTYIFVRRSHDRKFAALSLYMIALFPLMPFMSTRAFGESVAASLVCLGFGVLEESRLNRGSFAKWCFGFAMLGLATLFRFHVGLLFVSYGAILFISRLWSAVVAGFVIGLLTAAAQAGVDILSNKTPFATLLAYMHENSTGAVEYGVSPWYNTWLLFFGLLLVPFSLVFVRSIKGLWQKHYPILIPVLIYVLAHSLVPHKEERFLTLLSASKFGF